MQIAPEIHELEVMAQAASIHIYSALSKAGVARSTYWRWKNDGAAPSTVTVRKVRAAINELAGRQVA